MVRTAEHGTGIARRESLPGQVPVNAVSMIRDTLAVVLAGGRGSRLGPLTRRRSKPAMPFGGKFRIIDFSLSNCINSGIRRVAVVTQYMAQSLLRHTQQGWNFLDGRVHEFIETIPAQQRLRDTWYQGTADALYQNIDLLAEHRPSTVLVLAGDHVYRMDYSRFLMDHERMAGDVTVACHEVARADATAFGVVAVDESGRITRFDEKPAEPASRPGRSDRSLISMGIYAFRAELLFDELIRDATDASSSHDFGRDLLPALLSRKRVMAHDYALSHVPNGDRPPYWRDVGTVDAYWEANMDLTRVTPDLNLYDPDWPILSAQRSLPPAKFVFADPDRRGIALDSLVASGCIVSGSEVQRTLLSTNVRVSSYCDIRDAVILPDAVIGRHAILHKVIVDSRCIIPEGLEVGIDPVEDRRRFYVSQGGVAVITPDSLGQTSRYETRPAG